MPSQTKNTAVPTAADLGIVDSLVQLSFLLQTVLTRATAAHDLSPIQIRLLGVLRDREIGMRDLARILELEKSSVTGLVDRAEARGHVRRVPVVGDRRAVRVVLTPLGRSLAAAVHGDVAADVAALVAPLSASQRSDLARFATTVVLTYAGERDIPL